MKGQFVLLSSCTNLLYPKMSSKSTFLSLLLLLLISLASSQTYIIHEKRTAPQETTHDRQRIEPDAILPMRISLRQNAHALSNAEKWLMDVSDPKSPNYGHHWSQKDVHRAFAPSEESLKAVTEWLADHGIRHFTHSDNRQWLVFELSAEKAEALLRTEFWEYRNQKGGFEVSCDEYSLPVALREHVDFVMPGVVARDVTGRTERSREVLREISKKSPRPPYPSPVLKRAESASSSRPPHSTGTAGSGVVRPPYGPDDIRHCDDSVSPACIRALYKFDVADPNTPVSSNNSMGVFEEFSLSHDTEILATARQGDLNKFFEYYTNIPAYTSPIFNSIDGAVTRPNQTLGWRDKYVGVWYWAGILSESTLDLEIAMPIIYPQTLTVFQTDDPHWANYAFTHGRGGFLNTFLDAIDGSYCTYSAFNETGNDPKLDPKYPDSRPHGYRGRLQCGVLKPTNVISISYGRTELSLPASYAKRQCLEFLKLGLQGVSVFASSGDLGVGPCTRPNVGDPIFGNHHPASCPWLTSVGETHIPKNHTVYDPEWARGESGGGFSNIHPRPSYQEAAVPTFFKLTNSTVPYYFNGQYRNNTGRYNRNGRGYPDVAAVGYRIANIVKLGYTWGGGTSAATPIVASLINRIIEERIRANKGRLGFVNPVLYQNSEALNDIVVGNNYAYDCLAGFKCAPGWDPVSGLGTPNYPKLLKVFLDLP